MDINHIIQTVSVYAIPLILAITIHEAAHAYVANKLGDNTAQLYGRLTLNPAKHIDPLGTIIFPMLSIVLGAMAGGAGFVFGWAKPVPINFGKLRRPKKDLLWVALAGPVSNLIMAILWALILKASFYLHDSYIAVPLSLMAGAGMSLNISLMLLNMLPVLPLDGGRILVSLLPHDLAVKFSRTERYGMMILILLLFMGGLTYILSPLYGFFMHLISSLIL